MLCTYDALLDEYMQANKVICRHTPRTYCKRLPEISKRFLANARHLVPPNTKLYGDICTVQSVMQTEAIPELVQTARRGI